MALKQKQISTSIYILAAIFLLLGSYLKVSHNPYGTELTFVGLAIGVVFMIVENTMLKKKVKDLEKE